MSRKDRSSVAPKERINIKYVPNTLGQVAEVELSLKLLVVGDLNGVRDNTPVEERQPVSITKNNFNSVLGEAHINLSFTVPNRLEDKEDEALPVNLAIRGRALGQDALSL